jgi:hypothetical protein
VAEITPSQRDALTRTLTACADAIESADTRDPDEKGDADFVLAEGLIRDVQWLFESPVSPRETTVAARQLKSLVIALQTFNKGSAAPSVSEAQAQIGRLVLQLDSDQTDLQ